MRGDKKTEAKESAPLALHSPDQWAEPEEMAFWREQVRERAEKRRAEGVVKGMALELKDPEKAARALFLISTGNYSKYRISKDLGVMKLMVDRLEWHHAGTLESRRKELALRFTMLAEKMAVLMDRKVDDLVDDPDELKKIPFKDLSIAMGVMTDKSAQMAGLATVKIEHVRGPSVEDYQAMIEAARGRLQKETTVVDAEVVG